MKEEMLWKSLVFGIIVLFIGVSFMPSLSGDVKDLDLSYVKDVNYFESKNLEPGQTDDGTIETGKYY